MFQGVEEESTFETTGWEDDEVSVRRPQAKKTAKKQTASDFRRQFSRTTSRKKSALSSSISRWPILKTVSVISPWKS